jgi:hypothetical protein
MAHALKKFKQLEKKVEDGPSLPPPDLIKPQAVMKKYLNL